MLSYGQHSVAKSSHCFGVCATVCRTSVISRSLVPVQSTEILRSEFCLGHTSVAKFTLSLYPSFLICKMEGSVVVVPISSVPHVEHVMKVRFSYSLGIDEFIFQAENIASSLQTSNSTNCSLCT